MSEQIFSSNANGSNKPEALSGTDHPGTETAAATGEENTGILIAGSLKGEGIVEEIFDAQKATADSGVDVAKGTIVIRTPPSTPLIAFLLGTTDKQSPLSLLRGNYDAIRYIWKYTNEQWWDLHIDRFFSQGDIAELLPLRFDSRNYAPHDGGSEDQDGSTETEEVLADNYPDDRKECSGCPIAVISKKAPFPDVFKSTSSTKTAAEEGPQADEVFGDALYVNMMPFLLYDERSLPKSCRPYWPLIERCTRITRFGNRVAYLTIDERPVFPGQTQRRRGIHVDSAGVLSLRPSRNDEEKKEDNKLEQNRSEQSIPGQNIDDKELRRQIVGAGGAYIPGAEHHWGRGMMMRDETVIGGIFMASTIADSCAVWNCAVRDESGRVIGPHGDLEHCRDLLGPPTRTLDACELVWMTDRTPHESLPLKPEISSLYSADTKGVQRQFFRLVVGEVTAWFADHSTANPLGTVPPKNVRIVYGDKFALFRSVDTACNRWSGATAQEIEAAKQVWDLNDRCFRWGLGHLIVRLAAYGVKSTRELVRNADKENAWSAANSADGIALWVGYGYHFYDKPQMRKMVEAARAELDLK